MRGFFRFLIGAAIVIAGLYLVLRYTCLEIWTVPDDDPLFNASIAPTLEAGDVVVLWRGGKPSYGDLVRCTDPESPGRFQVGRLLGEGGDMLSFTGPQVAVNKKPLAIVHGCAIAELTVPHPVTGDAVDLTCAVEQAGAVEFTRAQLKHPPSFFDTDTVTVPNGKVFLVSDNRALHDDSRDVGSFPREGCGERIAFRLFGAKGWKDEARRLTSIH